MTYRLVFISLFGWLWFFALPSQATEFEESFRPDQLDLAHVCERMYAFREEDIRYPIIPKAKENSSSPHCKIHTKGKDYTVTHSQYYSFAHKTLRFVCKGKRPIFLDFLSSISGCNGELRNISINKEEDRCYLNVEETNSRFLIPKENIQELKDYVKEMTWAEHISLALTSELLVLAMDEVGKCES